MKGKLSNKRSKREQPAVRRFHAKDLQAVLRAVARHFSLTENKLVRKRGGYRNERAIAMELMYRHGGVSQVKIGQALGGLDYSAVSRERKRLREKVEIEKDVGMALDEIGSTLMSQVKI